MKQSKIFRELTVTGKKQQFETKGRNKHPTGTEGRNKNPKK